MKIAALILAAALPFAANAQPIPDLQRQVQITAEAVARVPFHNDFCRWTVNYLLERARVGGHAGDLKVVQIGLPFAQVGAKCGAIPHRGLVIASEWYPEDNLKCRDEITIGWDGVVREQISCE